MIIVGLNRKMQSDMYNMYVTTAATSLLVNVSSMLHPIIVLKQHKPLADCARKLLRLKKV